MNDDRLRIPASDGPKSEVGQLRYSIYRSVWRKIKIAKQHECWLEVITLTESVIADRLEARLGHLAKQKPEGRKVMTAAHAAKKLRMSADARNPAAMEVYEAVRAWATARNSALHELAKLMENTVGDWNHRYEEAKRVSEAGITLAEDVSKLVRRLNRPTVRKSEIGTSQADFGNV